MRDLKGIFSALLVSFNEDGTINEKGYVKLSATIFDKMKLMVYMWVVQQAKTLCFQLKRKKKSSVLQKMKQRSNCANCSSGKCKLKRSGGIR